MFIVTIGWGFNLFLNMKFSSAFLTSCVDD